MSEQEHVPEHILEVQNNPNLVSADWTFPDDLGMSRADVYPDKRVGKWTRRFMKRWIT